MVRNLNLLLILSNTILTNVLHFAYNILSEFFPCKIQMPTQSCYVIFKRRKLGIYNSWFECQMQVNGFKWNFYQSYKSLLDDETTYNEHK